MITATITLLLLTSILLIVFNDNTNRNNIFLAFLFLSLSIYSFTHYTVTINKSVFFGAIFYVNMTPIYLAAGPVLYLYVRNTLLDKFIFNKKDLFHFIPCLIIFIGIIPYLFTSFDYKLETIERLYNNTSEVLNFNPNLFFSHIQMFFIRLGSLTIYTLYNISFLIKYKREKFQTVMLKQKEKKITFNWFLALHLSLLIMVFFYLIFVVQISLNPEKLGQSLNGYMLSATILFQGIMILSIYFFPSILYGFPSKKILDSQNINNQIISKENIQHTIIENKKTLINSIEDQYYFNIQQEIESYFTTKKEFLNQNFKMIDLLSALDVPEHHIRYCLKNYLKKSFPQLKNEYRVKWIADILKSQTQNDYSIDGLGFRAGYQSKSAFYNNFKDFYGLTPQEYQRQQAIKS